ncbi:MAG TPA: hypothetical protein VJP02_02215 [Candidatus Sulfotelmatobacter sp.]|nr:hypothetical protein [Candidatus Sulfotelmatobacter sp.]
MGFSLRTLTALLFFCLISMIAQAQQFSADVVYLDTNSLNALANGSAGTPRLSSRIYVSSDKIRLETGGVTGTILLVDRTERTAVALQPGKKAYQPLASGPSEYFRVDNVDDACPNWRSVADQKIFCEKVGPELVNGRETVKYQNKGASESAPAVVWIDKALKFVIKWQAAGIGADLRNIKEEQQAAGLFALPSDYKMAAPQKAAFKGFAHK